VALRETWNGLKGVRKWPQGGRRGASWGSWRGLKGVVEGALGDGGGHRGVRGWGRQGVGASGGGGGMAARGGGSEALGIGGGATRGRGIIIIPKRHITTTTIPLIICAYVMNSSPTIDALYVFFPAG
jgi:hypothetical protein